jgi:hypothetical protein
MIEIQYVWEHWKFNADQRIKAFNFFVVFAIFADGGVFAAIERGAHPIVLAAIGFLVVALAAAFWVIDVRSERLIRLSEPGLLAFEQTLTKVSRIFHVDQAKRKSLIRYKHSFRALFLIQLLFGASVLVVAVLMSLSVVPRNVLAPSSPQVSGQAPPTFTPPDGPQR